MDKYEGDSIYEVWRRGGNPDAVNLDDLRDYRDAGYYPEEAASAIIRSRTCRTCNDTPCTCRGNAYFDEDVPDGQP